MTFARITSFDGVAHGTGTPYLATIPATASIAETAAAGFQSRADQYPLYRGVTPNPREIPFRVLKGSTAASDEEWFATVRQLYAPSRGVRLLVSEHDGVEVSMPVAVTSFDAHERRLSHCVGMFVALDDAWTGTTATVDTTSPTTPSGTAECLPVVTLTLNQNIKIVQFNVTAKNAGGFADYPLMFGGGGASEGGTWDTSDGTATTPQHFKFFHDGRAVPFFIQDPGTADTIVHLLVACREGETVPIVCCYGDVIDNTVTAQAFDPGGLDLTAMSNATWVWRNTSTTIDSVYQPSVWEVLSAPRNRPGSWHPATVGNGATSFQLSELTGSVQINASGANLPNNADAIVLFCPVPAAGSFALQGFYPENQAGSVEYSAAVLYLRQGDSGFRQPGGTIVSGGYTVDGAVQIALTVGAGVNLVIDQHAGTAPPQLPLDADSLPTIEIEASVDGSLVNGFLANITTGDNLIVQDTYTRATEITVNTLGTIGPHSHSITTDPAFPLYFGSPNAGISFTDKERWWPLLAGVANTWVWSGATVTDAAVSLSLKPRYRL